MLTDDVVVKIFFDQKNNNNWISKNQKNPQKRF